MAENNLGARLALGKPAAEFWDLEPLSNGSPLPIHICSQERTDELNIGRSLNGSPFPESLTFPLQSIGLKPRAWRADAGHQGGQGSAWLRVDGGKWELVPSNNKGFHVTKCPVLLGITLTWGTGQEEGSKVVSGILFGVSQTPTMGSKCTV